MTALLLTGTLWLLRLALAADIAFGGLVAADLLDGTARRLGWKTTSGFDA
jgi:hypothetical protein